MVENWITQIIWILNSTEMECKGPNVEDALHGTHVAGLLKLKQ
jgi:hypothetical protein